MFKIKKILWYVLTSLVATILFVIVGYPVAKTYRAEAGYKEFLASYENRIIPLEKEANIAYFTALASGREEDYKKSTELNLQMEKIFLDKDAFLKLKKWKEAGHIKDPLLKRQLDIQYAGFISSQSDEKKIEKITITQSELEQKFNTFRPSLNGKEITDNEVENILKTSTNSNELKEVWEASKKIGDLTSQEIVKMAKIRNEIARDLGFSDFQKMTLTLSEQDPTEMDKIFDDLDLATGEIYAEAKASIDEALASKYQIKVEDLRPWHYQNRYFQEVPRILSVDLDELYKDKNVLTLAKDYFNSLGLPIDPLAEKSDLYQRDGKYQHAVAFNMDRRDDIRVIVNLENNNYWMAKSLHEFGHALYDQKIDPQLPWELRTPAHIFTTEAVALFFEDMVYSPEWVKGSFDIEAGKIAEVSSAASEYNRLNALIFSRWTQVMYRFEKAMYENPDQDLNKLWWGLVEKYQLVNRPENRDMPDWATKIHVIQTPVYYHNYMLGYLLSAQFRHYIDNNIAKGSEKFASYSGEKKIGEYFQREVFSLGAKYPWQKMIEKSTGEKLNPAYFADYVKKN
ncbi:MAG: M2 family metallopeptidase [Patescibacteria group bacterium]